MFNRAIVRTPGKSLINGLTSANSGIPNYHRALKQHQAYTNALKICGLQVRTLPADENFPDSTFIEDIALLTDNCAIITNPGAKSRRGETAAIKAVLVDYFSCIETIKPPGTVEAGDIMMVGSHFYIGLSERSNENGAKQIIKLLQKYGKSGSMVRLNKVLHLKTGLAYLEHNNLLACGEFLNNKQFESFNILKITDHESYAANCIWVNDTVLVPEHYPNAKKTIEKAGYAVIEVDVSEFRKLDGGLSCLSLRF